METQKEGVKGKGIARKRGKDDGEELVVRRETGIGGRWQDRVTGSCQGIKDCFGFFKRGHEFDDVYKRLNVNYSAPWVDMVTFKCKYSFFIWFKEKNKIATVSKMSMTVKQS